MKELLIKTFDEIKEKNPEKSLDEILYEVYLKLKQENDRFDTFKALILEAKEIDVFEYYTKDVNPELKNYITEKYFSEYDKNDKGHGLAHMFEVVRRSFSLNDTFKLCLDNNMIYLIATMHDVGKHIDSDNHAKVSADIFYQDENFRRFFTDEERVIMKEAIEDHGHAKDEARSVYGRLVSSADRNTSIRVVFIRSFHVAHERTPDMNIEEYLDYTFKRLAKRYSEESPENMFYEDNTYQIFLQEMRELLKHEDEFKALYCEINNITDRESSIVTDYPGELSYYRVLKK